MRLVRLRHGAVACALPIEQADVAESGAPSADPLALWGDVEVAPSSRYLRVQTHGGWRSLSCSEVSLADVDAARRWDLPPLVRALLALPHVVGVVELDGAPVWLLDLDRLE